MLNSGDVKDKRITLESFQFRACVEYYNGKTTDCGLFESLHQAQVVLERYPRDVWDGYDFYHPRYKGLDHAFRQAFRTANRRDPNRSVRKPRKPISFGRTLVDLLCR